MPSYKQAYEKAGGAAKLGDYGSWEKKAKAWNQKKYGTTEPTAKAKEQGVSKDTLAKQNKSNIKMQDTVTKARDPEHKITFGSQTVADKGIVKRSHIRSSSKEIEAKAPEGFEKRGGTYQPKSKKQQFVEGYGKGKQVGDTYTEAVGGHSYAGGGKKSWKNPGGVAIYGAGTVKEEFIPGRGMKNTYYNIEGEKTGSVSKNRRGKTKYKKTRKGRQEERQRVKGQVDKGFLPSKQQAKADEKYFKKTGIDLSQARYM